MVYESFPNKKYWKLIADHPGAGYQIKLTIQLETGMQSDFRDIRFSDIEDNIIPYWIESYTASAAIVWIKLTESNIIVMHYGDASATSASSISNTMETGSEFPGSSLDTDVFTAQVLGSSVAAGVSVANGECRLQIDDGYAQNVSIRTNTTFQNGYVLATRRKSADDEYMSVNFATSLYDSAHYYGRGVGYSATYLKDGSSALYRNSISIGTANHTLSKGDYHIHELAFTSDGTLIYITDGVTRGSGTDTTNLSTDKYAYVIQGSFSESGKGADTYIDWFYVRKYIAIEPTLATYYVTPLYPIIQYTEENEMQQKPGTSQYWPVQIRDYNTGTLATEALTGVTVYYILNGETETEWNPAPTITGFSNNTISHKVLIPDELDSHTFVDGDTLIVMIDSDQGYGQMLVNFRSPAEAILSGVETRINQAFTMSESLKIVDIIMQGTFTITPGESGAKTITYTGTDDLSTIEFTVDASGNRTGTVVNLV